MTCFHFISREYFLLILTGSKKHFVKKEIFQQFLCEIKVFYVKRCHPRCQSNYSLLFLNAREIVKSFPT